MQKGHFMERSLRILVLEQPTGMVWIQSLPTTERKKYQGYNCNTFSIHYIIPEKYCRKSDMLHGTLGRIWDLFFSKLKKVKTKRVTQNESLLQFFSFFVIMRFPVGKSLAIFQPTIQKIWVQLSSNTLFSKHRGFVFYIL